MSDAIRPAMRAEYWARHLNGTARIKRMEEMEIGLGVYAGISGDPAIPERNDALNPAFGVTPPYLTIYWKTTQGFMDIHEPQRLAALSLYRQPFGFTQEDITMLEDAARLLVHSGSLGQREFLSLRDRITALLPPAP